MKIVGKKPEKKPTSFGAIQVGDTFRFRNSPNQLWAKVPRGERNGLNGDGIKYTFNVINLNSMNFSEISDITEVILVDAEIHAEDI